MGLDRPDCIELPLPAVASRKLFVTVRPYFRPPISATVDLSRLTLEWVAITAVVAGLYFAWPSRKRTASSNSAGVDCDPRDDLRERLSAVRTVVSAIPDRRIGVTMAGDIGRLLWELQARPGVSSNAYEGALAFGDCEQATDQRYLQGAVPSVLPTPVGPESSGSASRALLSIW